MTTKIRTKRGTTIKIAPQPMPQPIIPHPAPYGTAKAAMSSSAPTTRTAAKAVHNSGFVSLASIAVTRSSLYHAAFPGITLPRRKSLLKAVGTAGTFGVRQAASTGHFCPGVDFAANLLRHREAFFPIDAPSQ